LFGHNLVQKLKGGVKVGEIVKVGETYFRYLGKQYNRRTREHYELYLCRICYRDVFGEDLVHHDSYELKSRAYEREWSRLLNEAADAKIARG
jgi:hypothetical protein